MGFRLRKSISLGGGFKVNLSKSGIGYSVGAKGLRITKTSKGNIRSTVSAPGTGLSYIVETKKKKNAYNQPSNSSKPSNGVTSEMIVNNIASSMVSEGLEHILAIAKRSLRANQIANIGICISLILGFVSPYLFILLCVFAAFKIYVLTAGLVDMDYTIDDDQKEMIAQRIAPMIKATGSDKVWRIIQSNNVVNRKYASGASSLVKREACKAITEAPFPFKTNSYIASFKTRKETLVFFPDMLFIMQGSEIGTLSYADITTSVDTTRYIENELVPKDAKIVDYTWLYVNKSGGQDKRFKDNPKLPICLYGTIEMKSSKGLNTIILCSNSELKQ